MNHSDIAALMKGVAPVIADLVAKTVGPFAEKVAALEAEIAELRAVDHSATVADLVAEAVGKLPPAEPGKDADPEETRQMVAEAVKVAVSALPAPEPGPPGEVDPVALAALVEAAVAKLPPAEPGKSVTVEDVAPMVADLVDKAVSALPAPEPGKSVTIEDVEPLVAELVGKAVAALPSPEPGPPGKLPIVKAWEDRVFREGECCTFAGSTWQANQDTGKAPPHSDWTCIAAAGEPGKDADEIEVRETYDPEADYRRLNIVALNGAAFIARKDDPGPCPGEGWQVIAMRGKPGEKGVPGQRGEPGETGPAGPGVLHLEMNDQGMLTLVNGDASTVELDMYPLLSKIGNA